MRINKIQRIENFGVYKSFDWNNVFVSAKPKQNTLQDINIIYGRNYSGKTTLSRIFRSFEKQETYSEVPYTLELLLEDDILLTNNQIKGEKRPIRVFNSDYRKENLSFLNDTSQDGEIKAFAVIGEDNVRINDEINDREQVLGSNLLGQETGLYKEKLDILTNFQNSKKEYQKKYQNIEKLKKDKATVAPNSIKRQVEIYGKVNYNVLSLEGDIKTVLENNYKPLDEKSREECLSCIKEETKELLTELPYLEIHFADFVNRAKYIIQYEIGKSGKIDELLRDAALSAWVREGMRIHEKSNTHICNFCGNAFSNERWLLIKGHFDTESEKLRAKGEILIDEIRRHQKQIRATLNLSRYAFYSTLQDRASEIIELYKKECNLYNTKLDLIIKQIEEKLNNITRFYVFEIDDYNTETLKRVVDEYNKLTYRANSITINKENNVDEARKKLRLQDVYDFIKSIDYVELIKDLGRAEKKHNDDLEACNAIDDKIKDIKGEIHELKKQLQDVSRGAECVNNFLNLIEGLSIRLVPKTSIDGKQVYFDVERNGETARNLSEGECSIIAFCYFVARLEEINEHVGSQILFIDDPICSLDSNHIFFVYSLIRAHIVEKRLFSQLFISTHNLDFLKYLKRLTNKNEDRDKGYNIFWMLIERRGNESQLAPMPRYLREYVTEFEYLFSQIYECAKSDRLNDSNYGVFYNFGNNARKFLELYIYFKRPSSNSNDVMVELFGDKVYSLLVNRVNNELSHLMGNLERGASSLDYKEVHQVANLILEALKNEDEKQYVSLLTSIGRT